MPFESEVVVRAHEIDAAGIAYYPRFLDWFHRAFEDFFAAETDAPYHRWIGERRVGWPTVHVEADFRAPVRHGERVAIALSFGKLGVSSIVCRYEARRGGQKVADAALTVVTTDLDALKSVPIPAEVREAMERFPFEEP